MHKTLFRYFLLIGMMFIFTNSYSNSILFEHSKLFKDVAKQAKIEQKAFFVYFSARWCAPCQIMNRTAFKDENVAEYIRSNFIAVKVDVDDSVGKMWQSEFNVASVPTMIFFDKDGQELRRVNSGLSGTRLLDLLRSSNGEEPFFALADNNVYKSYRVIDNFELNNTANAHVSNSGVFEVQVGKFAAEKDLQRQMNGLSDKFERHQFYILQERLIETTVFTLILSGFKNKHEAQKARGILNRRNYDARLIQL